MSCPIIYGKKTNWEMEVRVMLIYVLLFSVLYIMFYIKRLFRKNKILTL